MSEFRQYRLASQLFDRFSCLRDPNAYTSHLFSNQADFSANDIEGMAIQLAQESSDPQMFVNNARFLKEAFPSQFKNLVFFLQVLNDRRRNRVSVKSTPIKGRPSLSIPNTPQQQQQQNNNFNAELDDIARKLKSATNKLGRPVTSSVPVPLESNDQDADFLTIQLVRNTDHLQSLSRLPVAVQELCVIEDLLFLVLNLDGKYFAYHHDESNLKHVIFVDESIDASILSRLRPVLKAAYCASRLNEFVANQSRIQAPPMMQALAAALDVVLKDFFQVIMALDKKFKGREIGLHQFCFHLVPFTRSLQSLLHLTFAVESGDVRGGALIRLLEEKINVVSGDRQLKNTYTALLEGCAKPFLAQLAHWLETGTLNAAALGEDFMIVDSRKGSASAAASSDDLQDSRYTLNPVACPHLLQDLSSRILTVGVYRNIQSLLPAHQSPPFAIEDLRWDRKSLQDCVHSAYQSVNGALMNSLFQSSKLFDVMSAAKRFFFIQSSDFINNFLSCSTEELHRSARDSSSHQLQQSFDLALKNSSLAGDAFAEAFRVELATSSVYDGLVKIIQEQQKTASSPTEVPSVTVKSPKAIDVLNLTMKVDFPESLIMNTKAVAKYQLLFRHILQCLELIRGLSQPISGVKGPQGRQLEVMKSSMLQFVRTVHYYICFGVLEPHWDRFSKALKERRFGSVDEITATHMDFLDTCLRECMLTNSKLVQLLSMSWSTCSKFAALVTDLNARVAGKSVNEAVVKEVVTKFTALHQHFHKYVRVLIEALQYYAARDCDHYIANFLSSLDCQFYS